VGATEAIGLAECPKATPVFNRSLSRAALHTHNNAVWTRASIPFFGCLLPCRPTSECRTCLQVAVSVLKLPYLYCRPTRIRIHIELQDQPGPTFLGSRTYCGAGRRPASKRRTFKRAGRQTPSKYIRIRIELQAQPSSAPYQKGWPRVYAHYIRASLDSFNASQRRAFVDTTTVIPKLRRRACAVLTILRKKKEQSTRATVDGKKRRPCSYVARRLPTQVLTPQICFNHFN
jgi:hypothetical protein